MQSDSAVNSATRSTGPLLLATVREWYADDPFRHGAAMAYYAIFSIPGLLMIVIWTAGTLFGQEAIEGQVSAYIEDIVGSEGASNVEAMIVSARLDGSTVLMKALGLATLLIGATTLFFQLQKSLNRIWNVKAAPQSGLLKLVTDRATSLGLILVIAFLLLITLILSAALSVLAAWLQAHFGEALLVVMRIVNIALSLGVTTVLFAVMFKVLPDVEIHWRSVWVGALSTAVLFTLGKTLLGVYFQFADPGSSFGAAGTVILIMLWVNYTCVILFFGAKLSNVYARRHGHPITPSAHARWTYEYLAEHPDQGPTAEASR